MLLKGRFYPFVVPAQAGIQLFVNHLISFILNWISACVGVTHFGWIEVPYSNT